MYQELLTKSEEQIGAKEYKMQKYPAEPNKRCVGRARVCQIALVLNVVFLLCQGMFCLFGFQPMFEAILQDKMTIKPGTPAYDAWKNPSIATITRFYLWSVKNPREVEAGSKPALEEIGPFTYSEKLERINEVFHPDGTVSYETKKVWHYMPDESLPLSTVVTTVDIPVLATAEFARGNYFMESANYYTFSSREGLFVDKTAEQLMFEGYSDSLLTLGSMFAAEGGIPMDKFGWFYKRNGTTWSDGVVTMATGTQNFQEVGNIKLWKGSNRTIYPSYCGDLRGTSAGFTAFTEKDRNYIDFFSTDICRPIRFDRDQEIDIRGVKGTRFSLNATKTFGNAETNPENSCYHANLPTGVHNSTGCKGGDTTLKTFVSLPHFLGADPFFIEQFEEGSIQPDGDRHSASMTLEMDTAIPIQVLMRLQIILQIRPNPNIGTFFEHLPEVFLPVIWFDAEAVIDEENASQIQMLSVLPSLAIQFGYVSLVGCSICILALIIFRTRQTGTSRQQDSKVDMDVDMSSNTLRASSVKMDSSELQTKKL